VRRNKFEKIGSTKKQKVMKQILLATDYSPAARNAGDYAAQLAKAGNTSLTVLHTWTPPVAVAETGGTPMAAIDFTDAQREAVEAEAARLEKQWGILVKGIQKIDFAPSGIADEFQKHEFSFVVLGMAKHNAAGRFLGSVATMSLHKAKYAVLVIPEEVSYHQPRTVLLATDLKDQLNSNSMEVLKQLSDQFDLALQIVNVKEEDELWNLRETNAGLRLDKKLAKVKHDWHFSTGENVADTILEEAEKEKADWVAVAPHRMRWYEELFHRSVSRKLAFEIDRPLLILPAR
jgi:nucleotide-binding universal stress UspA family protein